MNTYISPLQLLEELKIMDYSLLVGIPDIKRAQKIDRRRSLSMVYLPKTEEEFGGAASTGFNGDSESDWSGSESDEYKQWDYLSASCSVMNELTPCLYP